MQYHLNGFRAGDPRRLSATQSPQQSHATVGQADGIACRSMEMFDAFGFADKVLAESCRVNETAFWRPKPQGEGLMRADRIKDVEDELSHLPHVIHNQSRVHDFYLECLRGSPSRLEPAYADRLVDLGMTGHPDYPVMATFDEPDEALAQRHVCALRRGLRRCA